MASKRKTKTTAHIIVDENVVPKLGLRPGMKFEVHATTVVDASLKKPRTVAARLCGGTSTCIALVEIDRGDDFRK